MLRNLSISSLIFIVGQFLFVPMNQVYAQKEGYQLVWQDEFNGTELDTSKWKHRGLGPRRGGTVVEDAVSLDGKGNLLITTTILDSLHYHVGMISTQETYNTTYGYFECRAKFSKKLAWDSFWLQCPTAYQAGSPSVTGAEIDIFEYTGTPHNILGYDVNHNIHWADESGKMTSWGSHSSIVNAVDDYVKVAVEWTPDRYIFYVNDVFTFTTTQGLSKIDEYIILSVEPYWWKDLPDSIRTGGASVQDTFFVDYVRVYKKVSTDIIKDESYHPESFNLYQNYPNPFNSSTQFSYSIPQTGFVSLKVFDLRGAEVASLVNRNQAAGKYIVNFDASNLPSGVYYYRLMKDRTSSQTRKLLLVN